MNNRTSLWFPNLQSCLSAVVLAFTTGLLSAGIYNVSKITRIFDQMPPRWDLFVGMLALLAPILMIAFGHHWLNLVMDRFSPDTRTSSAGISNSYWPTLSSWWEGLYGWFVVIMATLLCIGIGGLLMPYRHASMYDMGFGEIYFMLTDANKFKYIFSPPFIIWIFSAAYLYQFESIMRHHFSVVGGR